MKVVIEQGIIAGTVLPPPSKSMTQRAYAAALLHNGRTIINNRGRSDDEQAALHVIQQLGAKIISESGNTIVLESTGINPVSDNIDCGESGLASRLFSPIAALGNKQLTINGNGSLLKRPMEGFAQVFAALGVTISEFNGYLPLTMQGPIQPKHISIDGSAGSQFLSGLLFAFAYSVTESLSISVSHLKSKPYIDMTLQVLDHFGRPVKHNNYREFYIDPSLFTYPETVEFTVEADWSSAAFPLVAGAIAGNITVQNLSLNSTQADKAIIDVIQQTGATVTIDGDTIAIRAARLQPFDFDATHCPDLFPVLSILAACCEGESSITGVHRLFYKESNRVESITEMLFDFAVPFSVEEDTLFITGVDHLQGTIIDSYNDHRIVMAAAIGALRAQGPVDIADPEVVNKSYPGFFDDLMLFGGKCTFVND